MGRRDEVVVMTGKTRRRIREGGGTRECSGEWKMGSRRGIEREREREREREERRGEERRGEEGRGEERRGGRGG